MPQLQSIGKFLKTPRELAIGYIYHPEYESLYLRKRYRIIQRMWLPVLEIEYAVAHTPGRGAFRRLVDWLHPHWNLTVCDVINPDLREHLLCRGFTDMGLGTYNPTYYLLHSQPLQDPCNATAPRNRARPVITGS
jgi:hypothetical protein